MAAKVFEHLTFDKGKTVKEVYKILNRCMAEEKTVRIFRKAMLENSIARQRERLDKYIDLCADGIITKQELAERRKDWMRRLQNCNLNMRMWNRRMSAVEPLI